MLFIIHNKSYTFFVTFILTSCLERSYFMIDDFLISLGIMWKGMFGIFAVIILITLLVMFMLWVENKLSERKKSPESES